MSTYINAISGERGHSLIEFIPKRKFSWGARLVEIITSPFYALFGIKNSQNIAITVLRSAFVKEMGDLERLTKTINLSFSKIERDKARAELMKINLRSYDEMLLYPEEKIMLKNTLEILQERHGSGEIANNNMERHAMALCLDHLEGLSREISTATRVRDLSAAFSKFGEWGALQNLTDNSKATLKEVLATLMERPAHITRPTQRDGNLVLVAHPFGTPILPLGPLDLVDQVEEAGATAKAVELIEEHCHYIIGGGAGGQLRKVAEALEKQLERKIARQEKPIALAREQAAQQAVRFNVRDMLESIQPQIFLAETIQEARRKSGLIEGDVSNVSKDPRFMKEAQAALEKLATIDSPLSDRLKDLPLKDLTSDKIEVGARGSASVVLQNLEGAQKADRALLERLSKVLPKE